MWRRLTHHRKVGLLPSAPQESVPPAAVSSSSPGATRYCPSSDPPPGSEGLAPANWHSQRAFQVMISEVFFVAEFHKGFVISFVSEIAARVPLPFLV